LVTRILDLGEGEEDLGKDTRDVLWTSAGGSIKWWRISALVRECIQKFPDWVDNETNNNKHSLRGNTKGCDRKTH
jgi:hypothetical protein